MPELRRCRALHNIVAHQGLVKVHTIGTIEAETDNLGRRLIKVLWETGLEIYVFPHEIEVLEGTGKNKYAAWCEAFRRFG
jgi:hypothetical protein